MQHAMSRFDDRSGRPQRHVEPCRGAQAARKIADNKKLEGKLDYEKV